MSPLIRIAAAAVLAVSATAFAQTTPIAAGAGAVRISATVEAIDLPTRMVTLRGENGEATTFKAGPEVKNLAQVKQGDVVTIEYARALALELKAGGGGIASRTESPAVASAKPGQMPAVTATDKVVINANVTAVDTQARTVTLRGPQRTVTVAVKDPAMLATVKVGDQVQATFTEALLISVAHPPKK
jgi:Cu/Ag efflux protein CusF